MEILTKIRDKAGNHYFRAWAENGVAIDISREWLKAAFTAKNDSALVETIMPLLHVSLFPPTVAIIIGILMSSFTSDYRSIAPDG